MNRDFVEMLAALCEAEAEFMVVGAHAVAAYSRPRATGDLDLWVRAVPANAARVWKALVAFGAPLDDLTQTDLAADDLIYQIGVVPTRIDILTSIEGVAFADAWPNRTTLEISGLEVAVIGRDDLIRNKRAVGRKRDLADVAALEGAE